MAIKINFCDMYRDFNPYSNFIVDIISKRCGEWEISDNPDIVFFSCSGTDHYKYDNCVKVFVAGEPVTANFSICDYAIAFPYMEYNNQYLKRPAWFTHKPPISIDSLGIRDEELVDRKFCNFVYSNDSRGTAIEFRKNFAKKLMEYKTVDCPGRVLNNMPPNSISSRRGDWREGKIDFIKNYKFTIAFENCQMAGYSTEKLEDPLIAHSLPIYWGDPMVESSYNINSFLCVNGLEDNIEKVIENIIYLDTHDDEYLKMLKCQPELGTYSKDVQDIENFIVRIVRAGRGISERDPLGFGRVVTVPDYRTKELINMLGRKFLNKFSKS